MKRLEHTLHVRGHTRLEHTLRAKPPTRLEHTLRAKPPTRLEHTLRVKVLMHRALALVCRAKRHARAR